MTFTVTFATSEGDIRALGSALRAANALDRKLDELDRRLIESAAMRLRLWYSDAPDRAGSICLTMAEELDELAKRMPGARR